MKNEVPFVSQFIFGKQSLPRHQRAMLSKETEIDKVLKMKVTLDSQTIQIVNLFQNITGTSVIDCISEGDEIYFVVAKGQYGLAIGKNGSRIRLAERVFKKTIKIFEYSSSLDEFIKNMTGSDAIRKKEEDENLLIVDVRQGDRARIIGKNGKNIKIINRFLERLFNINLKVR